MNELKKNSNNLPVRIERYSSAEETAERAGDYINDILAQCVDKPVLFLVAGGSALSVLEFIKPEYVGPDMTVTTTDDRFSMELDINNFSILQTTSFYNSLVQADAFCISTEPFEGEALDTYARRFEKNLKEWKQDFPKGIIVGLYGVGKDGHTGGMIPGLLDAKEFDAEFNTSEKLVGVFDAKTYKDGTLEKEFEFPQRISTTLSFMRDWVDHAVFYIVGESKKDMFKKLEASIESSDDVDGALIGYSKFPISIVRFMKDSVVFTDIL